MSTTNQGEDKNPRSDEAQLGNAQTLLSIAMIAGPVSLLFGGLFLGVIALICAILAHRKLLHHASVANKQQDSMGYKLYRQTRIALYVCLFVVACEFVILILSLPMLLDALESGELAGMYDALLTSTPNTPTTTPSSTWG